jgi:GT2 family glycosyltransferase
MKWAVIIATCNRPDRLPATLAAVGRAIAATGEQHALVIVDNGSEKPAQAVVAEFARGAKCSVQYLRSEPYHRSRAMNAGIHAVNADWLAFTDDDTLPDERWLASATEYAQTSGTRIFGGRILPGEPERPLPRWLGPGRSGRIPGHVIFVRYAPMPASGILGSAAPLPFGANLFVRPDLFAQYGEFDVRLWTLCGKAALGGDDTEFEVRVRSRGEPIGYCHDALIIHPVHHERCVLRDQIRLAYRFGWREPFVFFKEDRPLFEPYHVPLLARWAVGGACDLLRGDPADAVAHLLKMTRCVGEVMGRWSGAYRKWAAIMEASQLRQVVQMQTSRAME